MTNDETDRNARTQSETLVISRTEDGFRVYNPSNPTKSYIVGGGPDAPTCTCQDFQHHEGDPHWRCTHILAVLRQIGIKTADSYEAEERRAIQAESVTSSDPPTNGNSHHQMVIKRSVSPDKRIDSLSVEFSCPVSSASPDDRIRTQAIEVLKLQNKIIGSFLATNGKDAPAASGNGGNGPIPARMLVIFITEPRVVDRILRHRQSERCKARDPFEPRAPPSGIAAVASQ